MKTRNTTKRLIFIILCEVFTLHAAVGELPRIPASSAPCTLFPSIRASNYQADTDCIAFHGMLENELTEDILPDQVVRERLSVMLVEWCVRAVFGAQPTDGEVIERIYRLQQELDEHAVSTTEIEQALNILQTTSITYQPSDRAGILLIGAKEIHYQVGSDYTVTFSAVEPSFERSPPLVVRIHARIAGFVTGFGDFIKSLWRRPLDQKAAHLGLIFFVGLARAGQTFFIRAVVGETQAARHPFETMWLREAIALFLLLVGIPVFTAFKKLVFRDKGQAEDVRDKQKVPLRKLLPKLAAISGLDRWLESLPYMVVLSLLEPTMAMPAYRLGASMFTTLFGLFLFSEHKGKKGFYRLLRGLALGGFAILIVSLVLLSMEIQISVSIITFGVLTLVLIGASAAQAARTILARHWEEIQAAPVGSIVLANPVLTILTFTPFLLALALSSSDVLGASSVTFSTIATGFLSLRIWLMSIINTAGYFVVYWSMKRLTGHYKEIILTMPALSVIYMTPLLDTLFGELKGGQIGVHTVTAVVLVTAAIGIMKLFERRYTSDSQKVIVIDPLLGGKRDLVVHRGLFTSL